MGQRINIQYSVDIDELATEVGRLIESAHLLHTGVWTPDDRLGGLTNETLERIDEIRLELADIDHRLNDVANIISGYLYYKVNEGQQPVMDNDIPQPPMAGDLDTQIEEFKSMLKAGVDEVSDQGS
tara:strand:- start:920 stop:1297 length:378 start_codon:yes stop_codon:yes gene_type:complete